MNLESCCELITDGEHGTVKDDKNGTCFLLSNRNMENGFIYFSDSDRKISESTKEKLNKRTKISKNTILVSTVGTIGKLAFLRDDNINFSFQRSVGIIKPNPKKINPYFLFTLLHSFSYQRKLNELSSDGSVQKCLFIGCLNSLEIPDVERPIQDRIAKLFNSIDLKIKNNIDQISTLSKYVDTVYKQWFVDFKLPKNLYKNKIEFKKINGTYIPSNWRLEPIVDSSLNNLVKVGIDNFKGNKIYLSTSETDGDKYTLEGKLITYDNRESRANMQPQPYSVWFARMKNSIKHISFDEKSKLLDKIILSTGFCGLQCTKITYEYIWSLVHSDWFERQKNVCASGSTQEAITDLVLSYINIIIPDEQAIQKFHEFAKDKISLIHRLNEENDYLKDCRKQLISYIMNPIIDKKL